MKLKGTCFNKMWHLVLPVFLATALFFQVSYAWFAAQNSVDLNATAEGIKNYYASGSGTADDPYILTEPRHLYNLSLLQCLGVYDNQKTYFKLNNNIDMAGMAIVPIGTVLHPFYGSFIGNNCTISNLWVSSIYSEVDANLINFDDVVNGNIGGEYIGFFGNIASKTVDSTTITGEASDFYLENIQVSTATDNSYVGLIAGNNSGSLDHIGVSNGVFKLSSGATYTSDYTLIGKNNVSWPQIPGASEGGKLLIDPNDTPNFTSISSGTVTQIPDSATDRAFFAGTLTVSYGGINTLYKYTGTLGDYDSSGKRTVSPTQGANLPTVTTANYETLNVNTDFWTRFSSSGNNSVYITSNAAPSFTSTISKQLSDGTTIGIPANCSWFKPITAGTCALAFNVQNMSSNASTAVYKFKRNANGTIDTSSVLETIFTFSKNTFSNKNMIYFDYEITKQDITDGYEFAIGKASSGGSNQAYLFYMILAGSSSDGGGGEGEAMVGTVDFVYKTNGVFPDMSSDSYTQTNTLLSFTSTSTLPLESKLYFNKLSSDNKVHYFSDTTSITITDSITGTPYSYKETSYTSAVFPFAGY